MYFKLFRTTSQVATAIFALQTLVSTFVVTKCIFKTYHVFFKIQEHFPNIAPTFLKRYITSRTFQEKKSSEIIQGFQGFQEPLASLS